ncbi:unnamed protein product [Nyctereutes procyonoides]|uniref:(raccoon dog) hypothetical protein n=1 Tax=Nyctereutes procyonoides TaxID=34880 RepID=A0A811ZTA1_NYCPR|nr:unnamed protein product [Nyctereutes procyonoides]
MGLSSKHSSTECVESEQEFHVHQPKCTKQRGRCSISFMEGISGEKRSDAGKTKTTTTEDPSEPRSSGFPNKPRTPSVPPCPSLSRGLARESPAGPPPKTTESCRTAAPQAGSGPRRPPAPTGSDRLLGGGGSGGGGDLGGRGGAASRGPGARPPPRPLCLSGSGCPRRAPRRRRPGRPRRRPGAHTPGIVLRPEREPVRASRGRRTSGHDGRMTPPSLCFQSRPAGPPPPEAPPGARGRPGPPTPTPRPGASRRAPSPRCAPLTLRGQERRSRARARRRRGGAGPRPPGGTSRAPRSGRRGPGAGRRREARGGRRGRRRGDRRPRRLTLLAALARRRLTPPPAAGWADSEGDRDARGQAWAPRGPAGGALRRLGYGRGSCVAPGSERASSPGAHGSRAPAD